MTRRVVHAGARPGARLTLEAADLRHLAHSLRALPGLELEVLDGKGGRFRARYHGVTAPQIEVLEAAPAWQPLPLTLALGVIKGPRMDWAVEKLSELGVERLVPLVSERTFSRTVAAPRVERWRRIARESAKQCGRARLLEVSEPSGLEDLAAVAGLAEVSDRLLLDPGGVPLTAADVAAARPLLVVGPEGGFSPNESEALAGQGYRRVGLRVPVLRSETAAVAIAAVFALLRETAG